MADNRPRTIDECDQIAHDAIMRRTQRPTARPLQAAADILRTETDPRWRDVADHLDVVANNMAWLAPYHDHEPGSPMWYSAVSLAHTILTEETDRG